MLDITTIEDALYIWVSGVTGITTILADQNAPRPLTPYALINILQSDPKGIEEHVDTYLSVDKSIDIDYSNLEELMISINTYYSGAYQTATKIKDSLGRVTVKEVLFGSGLGYIKATTVRDIPEEIDKQWEERAQFDCFFFTRSIDSENIETIRKIELTNELDGSTVIIEHPDDL